MDHFVHSVYDLSASFPKDEAFGATSQLRRAALSVVLNYVEGYARKKKMVLKNFLETSYGSLKESKYLLLFAVKRKWLIPQSAERALQDADTIGRMLWGILRKIDTTEDRVG